MHANHRDKAKETAWAIFAPTGLGENIFKERYAHEGEDFAMACLRVAKVMASAEEGTKVEEFAQRFFELLSSGQLMPGGRIMYGAGRPKQQLMNCFVIPTHDSREGWGKSAYDMIITTSLGGGLGGNMSSIRPRGASIAGQSSPTTGSTSMMHIWNSVGDQIVAGGGRRLALMLCLDLDHPDIEEFLKAKLEDGQLKNANISVVLPPHISGEEFQRMVRENEEIPLRFNGLPDKQGRTINARDFWYRLVKNAHMNGEPGILNGHLANKMNNLAYKYPLPSTNPCFSPDMRLLTDEGYKTFGELHTSGKPVRVLTDDRITRIEDDWSINWWGPKTATVRQASHVFLTKESAEVVKVITDGMPEVTCTPDHHFATQHGMVEAQDLKLGDRVLVATPDASMPEYDLKVLGMEETYATARERGWVEVRSVAPAGISDVYCITEPETNSIIVNGMSTRNCGEQWLPDYGSCNLGALVLPRFVEDGKVNWATLENAIRLAVRFHDNVITVNDFPLPEMKALADGERRIGLGVMGLHSMMLDLGIRYNTQEGYDFAEKLFSFMKNTAYDTSVNLAIEKGPFPFYAPEFCESGFMKTLKPAIRRKVKEYGIRNCALLTVAPTGTTSMVQGVTGGIEPLFAPAYIRRRKKIDELANEYLVETLVISKEYTDHPELCQGAYDIHPREHLEMQRVVQKHLDSSLSKTINLPEDFPVDELAELWLEYLPHMKGSTFYRQGSRGQEPMQHVSVEDIPAILDSWQGEVEYEEIDVVNDCIGGSCDI